MLQFSLLTHLSLHVFQVLDVRVNCLRGLPDQLTGLQNLKRLTLDANYFNALPMSISVGLTALETVSIQYQPCHGNGKFEITSPLLPILHSGLVQLALVQERPWGPVSLFHLGCALVDVADRNPIPSLLF